MTIKAKKIPYYLSLILLTTGASLILGFLSFGGMYALFPVLPLACAAFGLSVAYEGEIYLQNIKGALNKIFKNNYLRNHLAKQYLLENLCTHLNSEDCPPFFEDYKKQLELLALFSHKKLTPESKQKKEKIEKTLNDMEKWFALQLIPEDNNQQENLSEYTKKVKEGLIKNKQDPKQWQAHLTKQRTRFHQVASFSLLSALFMGLGSTYLIVEAFSAIPWIAAIPFTFWPFIIVPMALIAGAAYGLLIYNTMTDLINNDTINEWYKKIRSYLCQDFTLSRVFVATSAVLLIGLGIALTVCTAGTWWTVANNTRPLFGWMTKIPSVIMGFINPVITGCSALFFNIGNTTQSLQFLEELTKNTPPKLHAEKKPHPSNLMKKTVHSIKKWFDKLHAKENWLQLLNPFRLLIELIITPLRILLFIGHLVSIALTADRMPGVPQKVAAGIAFVSEGFEDMHYFTGHNHHHDCHHHERDNIKHVLNEHLGAEAGHNHDADIPTKILKTIALPLYALATCWDCLASHFNSAEGARQKLTFSQAWNKQQNNKEEKNVSLPVDKKLSDDWLKEHPLSLIQKFKQKHNLSFEEEKLFTTMSTGISTYGIGSINTHIPNFAPKTSNNFAHSDNGFFTIKKPTKKFLNELVERVTPANAA